MVHVGNEEIVMAESEWLLEPGWYWIDGRKGQEALIRDELRFYGIRIAREEAGADGTWFHAELPQRSLVIDELAEATRAWVLGTSSSPRPGVSASAGAEGASSGPGVIGTIAAIVLGIFVLRRK
ncbi:MAG: hypothetical protein KIT41_14320 [Pyrinomonadaceae bacterium]|nr:hypothetical protein [Pyrinomonadaceae bacterium]